MFSAFWEGAYLDGGNLLIPAVHPGVDMTNLPIRGAILSHGFLSSRFIPIRVAFPIVASVLLGPSVEIPDVTIMDSFVDFISSYEGKIGRLFRSYALFYVEDLEGKLIEIRSHFGCRQMPTPHNIRKRIYGVARHEVLVKPHWGQYMHYIQECLLFTMSFGISSLLNISLISTWLLMLHVQLLLAE